MANTTKAGISALVVAVATLAYAVVQKDPTQIGNAILALLTGAGLIAAKDDQ